MVLILQVVAIEKRVVSGRLVDVKISMAFHENYPLSWFICHLYVNSLGVISSIEGKQFTKQNDNPKFLAGFYKKHELCDRFSMNLFNSYWFSYRFSHGFCMIFPWFSHGFPMDFPFPSLFSRDRLPTSRPVVFFAALFGTHHFEPYVGRLRLAQDVDSDVQPGSWGWYGGVNGFF